MDPHPVALGERTMEAGDSTTLPATERFHSKLAADELIALVGLLHLVAHG